MADMLQSCNHYKRMCSLVCPTCEEVWPCRICHDDARDHALPRSQVSVVVCRKCGLRQSPGRECEECGVQFAKYACLQCNLFDDDGDELGYFHCDDCGICRRGGRENFFHCSRCNMCMSNAMRNNHKCIQDNLSQNCPICMDYLFESREPVSVMKCGHTIHTSCMKDMLQSGGSTCPLCLQSVVDMSNYNLVLRRSVGATQMPEEYRDVTCEILCNDCTRYSTVLYHVLGLECPECGSFNTRRSENMQ